MCLKQQDVDLVDLDQQAPNRNKWNLVSKILKINEPVICELILDSEQEQMPKAINRRTLDGRSIPTTFEDMYPFLPKNELKSNIL